MNYSELQVTSNFSFLRGGSHPEEIVEQAHLLGYTKIALTDRNSLSGIVRAHVAAKVAGIGFIPGCRLDLLDGPSLLAYPSDIAAYGRLSALLTLGNRRAEKGECFLYKTDVYNYSAGIKFIAIPPDRLNSLFDYEETFKITLKEYRQHLGDNLYVAASRTYSGDDAKKLHQLFRLGIPMVATNDVYYHEPGRRQLQDILTCIREKCTIYNAGFRLYANAERYLKPVAEMQRLFMQYPEAVENAEVIATACMFSLDDLKYLEPDDAQLDHAAKQKKLAQVTWQGAHKKYGRTLPKKIVKQLKFELEFLKKRRIAWYFLLVYKYTRKAFELGILYQGRGSAANSALCFCLEITAVDPMKSRLLFSRFMSDARDEWPDIDVDFEHERREEIMQWIYQEYDREHAAIVATVTQERQKGAIRDAGKAMGLSEDTIKCLSADEWEFNEDWYNGKLLAEKGFNPDDTHLKKVLQLTGQLLGFPRQLGQHTGGFVITRTALSDICPVLNASMTNRTQLEWNKDDLEALGILKVDVLALGMLTCIRKGFDLAKQHYGLELSLANIPQDDPDVYEMITHAETTGVFQIESRAQMSMLPRLKPKVFYDLVIEVAIVRPGPIQGDMVHPYLRRRNGEEPVEYPSKELEDILGRTLGVPLFQEQAMEIAIVAAGFTPAEADQLRRSMATFKADGRISLFEKKLVDGMLAKGYERGFAERVFNQLKGFSGYGFPESHAASFALLVYISSWIKCYYPDIFLTALLNSQPMGFYQPAQLVADAKRNGVKVLEVDVNYSGWDNQLEQKEGKFHAVRLGFRQVDSLRQEDMDLLVHNRPYTHMIALRDAGVSQAALELLADADAFRSIGIDRRRALWEITALKDRPIELFKGQKVIEAQVSLPLMDLSEHVVQDYASVSLSLKGHPVVFIRNKLELLRVTPNHQLADLKDGEPVKVCGIVLVRQRPGTAKGVLFITLEDEHCCCNSVVFPNIFEKFRKAILRSRLLMISGKLQREGEVIHVVAHSCEDYTGLFKGLTSDHQQDLPILTLSRGDEKSLPAEAQKAPFSKSRNFR